jgi:CheY-like chemotaxis protein
LIILHVDDDDEDREVFLEAVKEIEPDVHYLSAPDGLKGLRLLTDQLKSQNVNYIFLDINMPLMDGIALLALIKANQKHSKIPVYIYSTTSSEKEIEHIKTLGAHFIPKDTDYRSLVKTLKSVLRPEN